MEPKVLNCNVGVCIFNPGLATVGITNYPVMIAICGGIASLVG